MFKLIKLLFIGGVLFIGLVIVLVSISGAPKRPDNYNANSKSDVTQKREMYEMGCDYIKKFLKHPLDADFPIYDYVALERFTSDLVKDNKDNLPEKVWYISSTVKAPNSFGAQLTHQWETCLGKKPNSWFLVYAKIDDKFVYAAPEIK